MKPCCRCGSIENTKVKGKGYCLGCNNDYGKRYYAHNREKRLKSIAINVATHRVRRKELVDRLKSGTPCMDCDGLFPPVCMDFDHRDGSTKKDTVSSLVSRRGVSMKRLMEEIAKCDLVCANCHRIRTHIIRPGVAQVEAAFA